MTPPRLVRAVQFLDGAITVEYVTPADDIKANGVTVNHALMIPVGDDYDDEIDTLLDAVYALLEDVLEDLPALEPMSFADDSNDDSDNDDDDSEE